MTAWNGRASVRGLRVAAMAALLAAAPSAWATATFSSAGSSSFALSPDGPVTSLTDHLPAEGTSAFGAAAATVVTAFSSGDGIHPASIESAVSGSAAAPPVSSASAFVQRGHVFVVDRTSPTGPLPTITLDFAFRIAWDALLSIELPGLEFASGGAFFAISGFEDGIDSIELDAGMPGAMEFDPVLGQHRWFFNPKASQLAGGPLHAFGETTVTGSITVLAGRVGEFSVITDVAGSAGARPLPLPSTVLLLAVALPGLARRWPLPSRRPAVRGGTPLDAIRLLQVGHPARACRG